MSYLLPWFILSSVLVNSFSFWGHDWSFIFDCHLIWSTSLRTSFEMANFPLPITEEFSDWYAVEDLRYLRSTAPQKVFTSRGRCLKASGSSLKAFKPISKKVLVYSGPQAEYTSKCTLDPEYTKNSISNKIWLLLGPLSRFAKHGSSASSGKFFNIVVCWDRFLAQLALQFRYISLIITLIDV